MEKIVIELKVYEEMLVGTDVGSIRDTLVHNVEKSGYVVESCIEEVEENIGNGITHEQMENLPEVIRLSELFKELSDWSDPEKLSLECLKIFGITTGNLKRMNDLLGEYIEFYKGDDMEEEVTKEVLLTDTECNTICSWLQDDIKKLDETYKDEIEGEDGKGWIDHERNELNRIISKLKK